MFRILDFLESSHDGKSAAASFLFPEPSYAYATQVCPITGYRANPYCPHPVNQPVSEAGQESETCPWHSPIRVTVTGKLRAHPECARGEILIDTSVLFLPGAMASYVAQKRGRVGFPPVWKKGCEGDGLGRENSPLEIVYPEPGAILSIGRGFDGKPQRIVCEAGHRDPHVTLFWFLDGEPVGTTSRGRHLLSIAPISGDHVLTITDEKGVSATSKFHLSLVASHK